MIEQPSCVVVPLSAGEQLAVLAYAKSAEIGGRSHIRTEDRQETLSEDQLVGMACQYAWAKYLGHKRTFAIGRYMQNKFRTQGDGGEDLPGLNVDVKGSKRRNHGLSIEEHHLLVRPRERHESNVYVLALYDEPNVILVGWLKDSELPEKPEADGTFRGAFAVQAKYLHPLPPFRWRI